MDRIKVLTLNTWNREGPYQEREPLIKAWPSDHLGVYAELGIE